jgi:UDP-N-acetyl-D-mannosaminuronate dehydrogenase
MQVVSEEPARIAGRAAELLAATGMGLTWAKVIVVGASCRPGTSRLAGSLAPHIMAGLVARGAFVAYFDPLVPRLRAPGGYELRSATAPDGAEFDLAVIHLLHPGVGYGWLASCPRVLDTTGGDQPVPGHHWGPTPRRSGPLARP